MDSLSRVIQATWRLVAVLPFLVCGATGVADGTEVESSQSRPILAGVEGATYPQLKYSVEPEYPKKARKRRAEGRVIMQAVVTKDGTVGDIEILSCDRKRLGFERAAIEAVRQWLYRPAERNGSAVDVLFTIRVEFELEGAARKPVASRYVIPGHQYAKADDLAIAMFTELGTRSAKCPFEPLSIQYCGRLSVKTTAPVRAKKTVDAFMSGAGAIAQSEGWTAMEGLERRNFRVGEVQAAVRIDMQSHVVAFSYPMQFPGCDGDGIDLPYTNAEGVTLPVLIKASKAVPYYPVFARYAFIEGRVILQAVVRKDGTVSNLCILSCSRTGVGFEEAALEAVRKWRYEPAMYQGAPVEVYFPIRVDFELKW